MQPFSLLHYIVFSIELLQSQSYFCTLFYHSCATSELTKKALLVALYFWLLGRSMKVFFWFSHSGPSALCTWSTVGCRHIFHALSLFLVLKNPDSVTLVPMAEEMAHKNYLFIAAQYCAKSILAHTYQKLCLVENAKTLPPLIPPEIFWHLVNTVPKNFTFLTFPPQFNCDCTTVVTSISTVKLFAQASSNM